MREVGIRELKVHTSKILRNLRNRRTRYIVAYRGRPVAILSPLEPAAPASPESDADDCVWRELVSLGNEIGRGWTEPTSSPELLSVLRR